MSLFKYLNLCLWFYPSDGSAVWDCGGRPRFEPHSVWLSAEDWRWEWAVYYGSSPFPFYNQVLALIPLPWFWMYPLFLPCTCNPGLYPVGALGHWPGCKQLAFGPSRCSNWLVLGISMHLWASVAFFMSITICVREGVSIAASTSAERMKMRSACFIVVLVHCWVGLQDQRSVKRVGLCAIKVLSSVSVC